MSPVTARTTTTYQPDGATTRPWCTHGNTVDSDRSLTAEKASVSVIQFSQEKFPDRINHPCVTITITPATPATGCGANSPNGTTSWVRWFAATSTRCNRFGRWWKYQLSGF